MGVKLIVSGKFRSVYLVDGELIQVDSYSMRLFNKHSVLCDDAVRSAIKGWIYGVR